MFENEKDLENALFDHKVYSAWQFIQFTHQNINTAIYCSQIINNIIDKLTTKTIRWEQDLFSDLVEDIVVDGKEAKHITVQADMMPSFELHVAGAKTDSGFLFNKLLRDFFQYSMNAFDSIAQTANAGLLANKGKNVDAVDFQRMALCFSQVTYKSEFPQVSAWFENISSSTEFRYIEAINNRIKHTADIANKLSIGLLGSSNITKIGPFFRKDIQHDERELADQLHATIDFINQSFSGFMTAFVDEFVKDVHVENRRHEIGGVYQQKFKGNPAQDLSFAYIELEGDFNSMPDDLYILLAKKSEEIYTHLCPFDQILVYDGTPLNVIGRYVADTQIGDDCLLVYRKYSKDVCVMGPICIYHASKKPTAFFHQNQFFKINAVSDDDAFLKRSSLPI